MSEPRPLRFMYPRRHLLALLLLCVGAAPAWAQGPHDVHDDAAAFTLSSSEVFTSRERPYFNLTFRRVTEIDFRVYQVRDPFAFFAGLRDPHQLGGEDRPVATERSWIERLSDWKGTQRRAIRTFVRDQVSYEYRAKRRAARDTQQIAQRIALDRTSFAQVPLLNPDQLVTSWRELLPNHRDAEYRRVPLEMKTPGVYLVEAVAGTLRAYTIVIVSDIGLVTKTAPGQMLVFAADRFTGEPQANCDVQVLANQRTVAMGPTNGDGVLSVTLPDENAEHLVSVVRCGSDVAATDPGAWYAMNTPRELVGYIYTDKPIYRPGHTVHVKAILRWRERDRLLPFGETATEIAVADANDKVVFRQMRTPDAFGAVHATFSVPDTAALGFYSIRLASGEHQANGGFEVQEYRRPEFEVVLAPASRFVVQGQEAVAAVQARYYFGQPVANARVRYVVNQQPYHSPLRWTETPGEEGSTYWYGGDQRVTGELRLDARGRGEIRVPLALDDDGRDYSVRIEAQVTDASSREVSGTTVVHATHGRFLLTAQVSGYMFRPSQSFSIAVRAMDYLGEPQSGVSADIVLEHVTYPQGYYAGSVPTEVARTAVVTDAEGRAVASLTLPARGGAFQVRVLSDGGDRTIRADAPLWVAGASEEPDIDDEQYLELVADKRTYAPGDQAQLALRGNVVPGRMLITKEGQQVSWHQVIRGSGDAIVVPIDDQDIGDINVHVAFMRDGRLYRAERRLAVPAVAQALTITLTAQSPVAKPQDPGVFAVRVTDAAGGAVRAQLSLAVIDEAVYAIRADDTPDPLRFFYRREYSRVGTSFSRDYYFTGFSGPERLQLATRRRRPFTLADFKRDKEIQPQVRKEFPDAIYWLGDLVTDEHGQATIAIRYPDTLTTWRLTARAVTGDTKVGTAVARTTTTKDLIVRVITPRFLTEGDEVVLPTVAHNYLPDAQDTAVTMAVGNLEPTTPLTAATGLIASGAERRDDWRVRATVVETATVAVTARTDSASDAVEVPIPVDPFGVRRELGTSGVVSGPGEEAAELVVPPASNPSARRITVSLAPSMAGSLLGALDYLTSFPYGCTEQTLSSFLPNVMVTRALAQLKLVPTERLSLLDRQVASGLRRLGDLQHDDGGWGWWKTDANHPFMTAYALFGLIEARRAGYRVDAARIDNGARALAQLYAEYPNATPDLKAYLALVLRRSAPDADVGTYRHVDALTELWALRARMTSYGRALLLLLLDEMQDRRADELSHMLLQAAQTRGDLTWWPSDHDPLLLDVVDTSVEATALALQALARRDHTSPIIDRGVRWLMLNRRGGYWWNTKQTAFALYGLLEVLQTRHEAAGDFSVDVYVNGTLAGTQAFTSASMTAPDPVVVSAPAREGSNTVRLIKRGAGALYWSAGATYYDVQRAETRSGTRQLAITRQYARLVPVRREGRILYEEQPFDGQISTGDVLSVRLTVAGSREWRYLIVEDPLPAGVEAIQDTTAYPMAREDRWDWWWGSQTEYRDNRTVFFQETFDGSVDYVYLVKATAQGRFRASPARVAPMYVPDVSASSEPLTFTIATAQVPQ